MDGCIINNILFFIFLAGIVHVFLLEYHLEKQFHHQIEPKDVEDLDDDQEDIEERISIDVFRRGTILLIAVKIHECQYRFEQRRVEYFHGEEN